LHIIGEVLHPDFDFRADDANGAHQFATHRGDLMTEHMLHPGADFRTGLIALVLPLGQAVVSFRPPVHAAPEMLFRQLFLGLG